MTTDGQQAVHINIVLPDGRETAIAFALPEQAQPATVFVVGRVRNGAWDLVGVFASAARAEAACTTADDFVGPWQLDVRDTEDVHPWEGQYFPRRGDVPLG